MPPPKASPLKNKKVLVIGALALLVVGYLFLRSKGTAAQTPSSSGATPGTIPQTGADPGSSGTDQSSADLLAALAGENQTLMKSFLGSSSGLVSLAGSSFGAPFGGSSTAGEPSGDAGFASTTSQPFTVDMPLSETSSDPGPIVSTLTAPTTTDTSGVYPGQNQAILNAAAAQQTSTSAGVYPGQNQAILNAAAAGQNETSGGVYPGQTEAILNAARTEQSVVGSWGGSFSGGSQPTPSVTVTQSKPGSGNLAA